MSHVDVRNKSQRHWSLVKRSLVYWSYASWLEKKDVENELGNTGHTTTAAAGSIAKDQELKGIYRGRLEGRDGAVGVDEFLNALNSTDMEGGTEYYGY